MTIYISAYVEATNRDAFMAVKQDLLQAFVDCCERNGARLARQRIQVRHPPAIVAHACASATGKLWFAHLRLVCDTLKAFGCLSTSQKPSCSAMRKTGG